MLEDYGEEVQVNPTKKRCRKVQYGTLQAARKALKELRWRGVRTAYRCNYCKGKPYHLSSQRA